MEYFIPILLIHIYIHMDIVQESTTMMNNKLTKGLAVRASRAHITVPLSPVRLEEPARTPSLIVAALRAEMPRTADILCWGGGVLASRAEVSLVAGIGWGGEVVVAAVGAGGASLTVCQVLAGLVG